MTEIQQDKVPNLKIEHELGNIFIRTHQLNEECVIVENSIKIKAKIIMELSKDFSLADLEDWKRVKDCEHDMIDDIKWAGGQYCWKCNMSIEVINRVNELFGGEE